MIAMPGRMKEGRVACGVAARAREGNNRVSHPLDFHDFGFFTSGQAIDLFDVRFRDLLQPGVPRLESPRRPHPSSCSGRMRWISSRPVADRDPASSAF